MKKVDFAAFSKKQKLASILALLVVIGAGAFYVLSGQRSATQGDSAEQAENIPAQQMPTGLTMEDGHVTVGLAATSGQQAQEAQQGAGAQPSTEITNSTGFNNAAEDKLEPSSTCGAISRGDSVGSLLQAWLSPADIHAISEQAKGVYALNRVRVGQPYSVCTLGEKFLSFNYEINSDSTLVIRANDAGGYDVFKEDIQYDIVLHRVEGSIENNLFQSMIDLGETPSLAMSLANVFAWEVNFIRDIRAGDSFGLLVEKRYRDGEFKDYGKLLAATFTNQGTKYEAFAFTDKDGHTQYFNSSGESIRRAFLKAPLAFNRISSGFTNRRLHPVTMTWKAHPAIDYAAPTGTPVKAIGKGTVTFVGADNAAGKHIKVKHLNNYETMYLHLSAYAKGLKKGQKVAQGQVIGFVGKTGYATGPHLDFRMKKNGNYVNPLRELSPRDTPVTPSEMPLYTAQVELFRDFFAGKRDLAEYSRELLAKAVALRSEIN